MEKNIYKIVAAGKFIFYKKEFKMNQRSRKRIIKAGCIAGAILLVAAVSFGIYQLNYWNLIPKKSYSAEDFGIETLVSPNDEDQDGVDDYLDLMQGARAYVETKPEYKSIYYRGGYPQQGIGVCTDVIWNAFRHAGYSLKDMVDEDIQKYPAFYPQIKEADPNIDFRRVPNLKSFFEKNATSLTLDPDRYEEWQPGDIVIYPHHIAMVSDKRNKKGRAYIIHHGGQPVYEEDALARNRILGHYRFERDKE